MDADDAVLALLGARAPGATICPSEVARILTAGLGPDAANWRKMMPAVHAAIDRLVVDRRVELSWKNRPLASRAGPYRIALRAK